MLLLFALAELGIGALGKHPSPGSAHFTVCKRGCGKVMFLHLSVSHSVHKGGLPQCTLGYTPRADTPTPQQTATAADGTHPTGMHSCFQFNFAVFGGKMPKIIGWQNLLSSWRPHLGNPGSATDTVIRTWLTRVSVFLDDGF